MKTFEQDFKTNPSFNTVTGLSNTTFDPTNVVVNRGASEGQVKYVYDLIKALQDWLDENGCSDDPYALIRQKVDELEEAIGICCANPQDTLIQMLNDRLTALQTAQEECCQVMDDSAYQALVARLTALETSMNTCCSNYESRVQELMNNLTITPSDGSTDIEHIITTTCEGGLVEVTYTLDTSAYTGARSLIVGQVNVNINATDGRKVHRYFWRFANPDGQMVNVAHVYAVDFDHPDITFHLHPYQGFIIAREYVPCPDTIPTISPSNTGTRTCDDNHASFGTHNAEEYKLYIEVIDTKYCSWLVEVPYSAFDFSAYDAANTP